MWKYKYLKIDNQGKKVNVYCDSLDELDQDKVPSPDPHPGIL